MDQVSLTWINYELGVNWCAFENSVHDLLLVEIVQHILNLFDSAQHLLLSFGPLLVVFVLDFYIWRREPDRRPRGNVSVQELITDLFHFIDKIDLPLFFTFVLRFFNFVSTII